MTIVSSVISEYKDAYRNLERAVQLAGSLEIDDGEHVIIKINLCGARTPETGAITHPMFLEAILHFLRENFNSLEISVVESETRTALPDFFINWFGFSEILEKWGAKFVNLSKAPITEKRIEGRFFKHVPVPAIFENTYFITLPKLKTNFGTGISCCLKNQYGCLPMIDKTKYHPHLDDAIADVNTAIKPDFCIVDGIISMGGILGPGYGVPIPLRRVVCGKDPVAVDSFCAKMIGLSPRWIGHIRKSASAKVGSMKYIFKGDDDPNVSFEINRLDKAVLRFGSRLRGRALKHFKKAWAK